MHVLITNNTLAVPSGTEMYVRDLALALNRQGIKVSCYSPKLGAVAEEIMAADIAVVDDLQSLNNSPDLIHAHHYTATAPALFAFAQTPVIFVCHGALPLPETPLIKFRQIRRYVAVDEASRDRLMTDLGLGRQHIRIIQNGIDTQRFKSKPPIAADAGRRSRALIFSNQPQDSSIGILQEACAQNGITLDVRGNAGGKPVYCPEAILGNYGLVFAKARAAMEAMACGAMVILSDYGQWGGAVRPDNFDALRLQNFGLKAITRDLDVKAISGEINALDWLEGEKLAAMVRERAALPQMVSSLVSLYEAVLAEGPLPAGGDVKEAAKFFQALAPLLYERDRFSTRLYEETKLRLGNEATSADLLFEAALIMKQQGNADLAKRLAQQVLFLQPGHPFAQDMVNTR
jgi:glycosyltransferase involved in cell wall biosynthesis